MAKPGAVPAIPQPPHPGVVKVALALARMMARIDHEAELQAAGESTGDRTQR